MGTGVCGISERLPRDRRIDVCDKQRCGLSMSKGQGRTYYFTWREAFTENHRRKAKRKRTSVPLLLERLYADGNVGFYAFDLSHFYSMIAFEYAQMHDLQKTLDALAESCRYAVIEANLKDMDYTAPMVNRLKYKKANTTKNYKGNACNLKLKALENRQFDFVREEDAFKKLIVMLEQNAE